MQLYNNNNNMPPALPADIRRYLLLTETGAWVFQCLFVVWFYSKTQSVFDTAIYSSIVAIPAVLAPYLGSFVDKNGTTLLLRLSSAGTWAMLAGTALSITLEASPFVYFVIAFLSAIAQTAFVAVKLPWLLGFSDSYKLKIIAEDMLQQNKARILAPALAIPLFLLPNLDSSMILATIIALALKAPMLFAIFSKFTPTIKNQEPQQITSKNLWRIPAFKSELITSATVATSISSLGVLMPHQLLAYGTTGLALGVSLALIQWSKAGAGVLTGWGYSTHGISEKSWFSLYGGYIAGGLALIGWLLNPEGLSLSLVLFLGAAGTAISMTGARARIIQAVPKPNTGFSLATFDLTFAMTGAIAGLTLAKLFEYGGILPVVVASSIILIFGTAHQYHSQTQTTRKVPT